MDARFPSKSIRLDDHRFNLHGIAADDHYWQQIQDDFEPEFQQLCRRLIQPDYVCVDIGANIGLKTLFLSRHCPQGRVIAIEAGKKVFDCLATNLSANGAHNATAVHTAVASSEGTIRFAEGSAWGHQAQNGAEVASVTLDTIVRDNSLKRLDFVKMDIEGMEFSVLQPSLELINKFQSIVYLEFNSLGLMVWGNTNPREFFEWISGNFQYVYAVNRTDLNGEFLHRVDSSGQSFDFLRRNLADDGFVTDLVLSNSERRFVPVPGYYDHRIRMYMSDIEKIGAERDAALRQVHALHLEQQALLATTATLSQSNAVLRVHEAEHNAMLASSSWRFTAPLRRMKRMLTD